MHKKNADTGPAARRGICAVKEGGLRHEQASLQPEWRKSAAASEDLPSDRAGNPRSNSSGTMRLSATIIYQNLQRARQDLETEKRKKSAGESGDYFTISRQIKT